MNLRFVKMNGAGNDFVLIDNTAGSIELGGGAVARICDRRRGVGADGLIMIEAHGAADFHMRFFNSDGGPAEMCGNGARCSAAFAANVVGLGQVSGPICHLRFHTDSGMIDADVAGMDVAMRMMDAASMRLNIDVPVAQGNRKVHFMTVGTRHVVVPMESVEVLTYENIVSWGREIRYNAEFGPIGANVNFASVAADGRVHIRTYEKGVEDQTHACGTGSVASAVALAHMGAGGSPTAVVQSGGDSLEISFDLVPTGATNVRMTGPVEVNFEGSLTI